MHFQEVHLHEIFKSASPDALCSSELQGHSHNQSLVSCLGPTSPSPRPSAPQGAIFLIIFSGFVYNVLNFLFDYLVIALDCTFLRDVSLILLVSNSGLSILSAHWLSRTHSKTPVPSSLPSLLLSGVELRLRAFAGRRRRWLTRAGMIWFNAVIISTGKV